jgi:hypothetical protein
MMTKMLTTQSKLGCARSNTIERQMPLAGSMATLSRWFEWRDALIMVKPETLMDWHRKGFGLLRRWKFRRVGRPRIPEELQCTTALVALSSIIHIAARGFVVHKPELARILWVRKAIVRCLQKRCWPRYGKWRLV